MQGGEQPSGLSLRAQVTGIHEPAVLVEWPSLPANCPGGHLEVSGLDIGADGTRLVEEGCVELEMVLAEKAQARL